MTALEYEYLVDQAKYDQICRIEVDLLDRMREAPSLQSTVNASSVNIWQIPADGGI